jgi:hypothetical protein
MIIYAPLLLCIVGGLAYLLCASIKWSHLGLVTYGVALLVFLMRWQALIIKP